MKMKLLTIYCDDPKPLIGFGAVAEAKKFVGKAILNKNDAEVSFELKQTDIETINSLIIKIAKNQIK